MRDTATFPAASSESISHSGHFWTWPRITLAVLFGLIATTLGVALGLYASWNKSGKIAPGMIVQGESLGGLSQDEASARLEKRFGRMFISLKAPDRNIKLSVKQLGGQVLIPETAKNAYWYGRGDGLLQNAWTYWTTQKTEQRRALPVKWDKPQLRQTMWTVATNYHRSARDAKLQVSSAGVQIIPHQTGRALNVGQTCADLQKQYFAGKPDLKAITKTVEPKLASSDLAGRDLMLGKYTTYFDSGEWGRTENIHLASDAINGKVLMPKEKFSFNAMTGERTQDKGYRVAHIFVHKPGADKAEVVDGRGGGVCQVSSTLYNAVRKTNNKTDDRLAILERNNHSLPVSYVPYGLDATVAWPHKDFQFKNTFAHPVYLRSHVKGSRLEISVWGRVPDDVSSITLPESSASTPSASDDSA